MITFIHKLTDQTVEIADDLRAWFLSTVADAEHWIDQDAPVIESTVEPSPAATESESLPEVASDAI